MIKDKDVKIETKDIKNLTPSIKSGGFYLVVIPINRGFFIW
jgi:hypothetical protein